MGVTHTPAGDVRPTHVESFDPADHAVPTGREEEWRFTPLKRLRGLHDGSADAPGSPEGKVVVEVDAAPEVTVETVSRDDARLGRTGAPNDRVAAQAWSRFERATVITVPPDVVASRPTVVTLRGEGIEGAAYGHTLVEVGAFSSAVVVLDHVGSATYADNVEVVVRDGGRLTIVSLQEWTDDAVHVSGHRLRVGRDAKLRHVVVSLGGDLVRIHPTVGYDGPGAEADLLGLYFADAGQHLEHRLFVDHAVAHCRSRVTYKGALQGEGAHTVWIGDVFIRHDAVGTDTYEINRNLVLTDGARADSVPNLEIETGEVVGAGHASTTGRFDDEQLFYLQSRGITEDEARRLVVRGFFADLLAQIGIDDLEARLLNAVDAELEKGRSMTDNYLRACPLADLDEDSAIRVELDGVPVCLLRSEGEVHAVSDICSHADVSLAEGEVDGLTIECWLHGSRFDVVTGRPTGLPATRPIPVYPVKIEGDEIYVSLSPLEEG